MMYTTIILVVVLINGYSTTTYDTQSLSPASDLFIKALIKTFQTPISFDDAKSKFSLDIMLANDVFTLDDALRLFIQQYLLALYDGRHDLLPDDWQRQYPAYSKIIEEINNILDLIGQRTLSQIGMKDIRPLVNALTPTAFWDLQRVINDMDSKTKPDEGEEVEDFTKTEL